MLTEKQKKTRINSFIRDFERDAWHLLEDLQSQERYDEAHGAKIMDLRAKRMALEIMEVLGGDL